MLVFVVCWGLYWWSGGASVGGWLDPVLVFYLGLYWWYV